MKKRLYRQVAFIALKRKSCIYKNKSCILKKVAFIAFLAPYLLRLTCISKPPKGGYPPELGTTRATPLAVRVSEWPRVVSGRER